MGTQIRKHNYAIKGKDKKKNTIQAILGLN